MKKGLVLGLMTLTVIGILFATSRRRARAALPGSVTNIRLSMTESQTSEQNKLFTLGIEI